MTPKKLTPVIFTTSKPRRGKLWFDGYLPEILSAIRKTKHILFGDFTVVPVTVQPLVFTDVDKRVRISHSWFETTLTSQAKKLGCNVVIYHFSLKERKAWGLDPKSAGTYWRDKNDIYECWVCADSQSEFIRIVKHEVLHGLVHFSGQKAKLNADLGLPTEKYDDPVHYHDYFLKDLDSLFPKISYQTWGLQYQLVTVLTQLVGLLKAKQVPVTPLPLLKPSDQLHKVAINSLGQDASPKDRASDELGCAETVSELINLVTPFPIITGTWKLWDKLNKDERFEKINAPEAGAIIISPTATGNGSIVGHTGICDTGNAIMSNDSFKGTFERNYTQDSWRERYKTQGGFPIHYYRLNKK